jgi:hypothetical protein
MRVEDVDRVTGSIPEDARRSAFALQFAYFGVDMRCVMSAGRSNCDGSLEIAVRQDREPRVNLRFGSDWYACAGKVERLVHVALTDGSASSSSCIKR